MDKSKVKRYLKDVLSFMEYKIDHDECSLDEMVSIAEAISKSLDVRGTIKDMSEFYGQSESNVRNVLNRRPMPEKPVRQVTYRFGWFASMVPSSWRKRTQ